MAERFFEWFYQEIRAAAADSDLRLVITCGLLAPFGLIALAYLIVRDVWKMWRS
jgi:hypothetical protein